MATRDRERFRGSGTRVRTVGGAAGARRRSLWVPPQATQGGAVLGSAGAFSAAISDTDTADHSVYFGFRLPSDFAALVVADVVLYGIQTGDLRWDAQVDQTAVGERSGGVSGDVSATTDPLVADRVTSLDVVAAMPALEALTLCGLRWRRLGSDPSDTVTNVRVLGLYVEYE